MIYIYDCFGGTHSSVLAAAYHLNQLSRDQEPTKEEILNTQDFNTLNYTDMGKFFFHGIDDKGNKVYTLGRGLSKKLVPCLKSLITVLNDEGKLNEKIILSNTSPTVPLAMTLGGFFSRTLKFDLIGVPLLVIGVKQSYLDVIKVVNHTKQIGSNTNSNIAVLENETLLKNN